MFNSISRRSIVLLAGVGAALTLAACDSAGSVTQPATTQKSFQPSAHHDTFGRWVCP
jgi:hypothetical protein